MKKQVLPGLHLSLGITLIYFIIIIVLPLVALVLKAAGLGFAEYWAIVFALRAIA